MTLLSLPELLDSLAFSEHEHVSVCTQPSGGRFTARVTPLPALPDIGDDTDTWFGINPVAADALGRGKASDVTRLAALWADLDVKPGGCASIDIARDIISDLSDMLGTRPTALTYSGHGLQPLWAIDPDDGALTNDTTRAAATAILRRWGRLVASVAERYNTDVDSVFDLARVLRCPGSTNHKSEPVAVLTVTDTGYPLTLTEVRDALNAYGIPEQAGDTEELGALISSPSSWTWAPDTCTYAAKTMRAWSEETPAARHPWLISAAVRLAAMRANGCVTQHEHDTAKRALVERFTSLLSSGQARKPAPGEISDAFTWGTARVATMTPERILRELGQHPHLTSTPTAPFGEVPARPTGTDGPTPEPARTDARPMSLSQVGAHYGPTEDGTARAVVHLFADRLRYCPERGLWLTWTGSRWEWDGLERHREMIRGIARELPAGEGWASYKRRALSAAGVSGIARMAQSDSAITVHLQELDARPYELNTPGGIIDLKTGMLRPADPTALHTRSTSVVPDFTEPDSLFTGFLDKTFGGDLALIGYVQRVLGLSAIGTVLEQILAFAHGPGANGKSTLYEAAMHALGRGDGGYAISAPSEMLMVRKHSEHPAEIAQLAGARLVVCSELDDGQRFAEARIKQLTGRDSINARFMRRDPFTFVPSHTFNLLGNHKPAAATGGPAFWRRVQLIPFDHVVPEGERDARLGEKLEERAAAVLAWIALGARDYLANGLGTPEAVRAATAAYAADQDSVGRFVEEALCLDGAKVGRTRTSDVRTAYEAWCSGSGDDPVSARRLTQELRDRFGIESVQSNGKRYYVGVQLVPDEDQDDKNEWFR